MRTISAEQPAPAASPKRAWLGKHGAFWITGGVIALVAGVFIWFLFQPNNSGLSPGVLATGQHAPNFTVMDVSGHSTSLAALKGHPIILNFWGTFCEACRTETPLLQRTYQANQSKGLVILGVDQGEQNDAITQYDKEYGLTYPLLPDPLQNLNHAYGVTGLPVSYFIDGQGVIRSVVNGPITAQSLAAGLRAIGLTGA
jgi:cytochrome c biogenesis protein CcmG, thiol:disulfide interchange protein DsbE